MEQEQLTEFKIQLALPAPNIEIAQEVANKAQVLINQFGYYQFLITGKGMRQLYQNAIKF